MFKEQSSLPSKSPPASQGNSQDDKERSGLGPPLSAEYLRYLKKKLKRAQAAPGKPAAQSIIAESSGAPVPQANKSEAELLLEDARALMEASNTRHADAAPGSGAPVPQANKSEAELLLLEETRVLMEASNKLHADAAADTVVKAASTEDLLEKTAPASGSTLADRGQGKFKPLDIKSDLQEAMHGRSAASDKIVARITSATAAEIAFVLADDALMQELLKYLSRGPAIQVMQLLNAPLKTRLKAAMKGSGQDVEFMLQSLTAAPLSQVMALAADRTLQAEIDNELYFFHDNRFRARMARRLYVEGGANQAESAFFILQGLTIDDDKLRARLSLLGDLDAQRQLCDTVIYHASKLDSVRQAFAAYWEVEISAQDGAKLSQWSIPMLRLMHLQFQHLPSQDTRMGAWKKLSLSGESKIDPATGADIGFGNRAAFGYGGNFIVGAQSSFGERLEYGSVSTPITADSPEGATSVAVKDGSRFKVNDAIIVGFETDVTDHTNVKAVADHTLTVEPKLSHAHRSGYAQVVLEGAKSQSRFNNSLTETVRHEIAHAIDAAMRSTVRQFQEVLGGWWTGNSIDKWSGQMANPFQTNDGSVISESDQQKIKSAISKAVKHPKGSLFTKYDLAADHPIMIHQTKNVPIITAAESCLSQGDNFYHEPVKLHRSNGKVFIVSVYYQQFMYCHEEVLHDRPSDYTLYSPAEFFAESYSVFYEDAGKPGTTDDKLGRYLRNAQWRDWIRTNIHNRGQAPAGTGLSNTKLGAASSGAHGAMPGSGTGKSAKIPGP